VYNIQFTEITIPYARPTHWQHYQGTVYAATNTHCLHEIL